MSNTLPEFEQLFISLTGNKPFPWQTALYGRFIAGEIPSACDLPTGMGKTSVIAVWLIALAQHPDRIPRRLVYVVNRRTVVDQTTDEVVKYRTALLTPQLSDLYQRLESMCALPLAGDLLTAGSPLSVSTLRGQLADNREWSGDPTRPAVICGTVDMIGSRLLFNGYGVGFKSKPLHAGFLGQDTLLVHDEAHLEPAFQELLKAIEREQERSNEFCSFRVMELSATSRGTQNSFELSDAERNPPVLLPEHPTEPIHFVWRRQRAKKAIHLHENSDEKKLADEIADVALKFKDSTRAILVFVRKVEDVEKIVAKLRSAKQATQQLTGTLRGLERDQLVKDPIFRRFLPNAVSDGRTVFLVCTSAGEVGVNISADHLVSDLSTFDSMAQRFGRVNRFGDRVDTEIHVIHPVEFDDTNALDLRRRKTYDLLIVLKGDASPKALSELDSGERRAAFAPTPTILPTSDILFDAWALTTIRGKLPGRPPVEPYLHGISGWEQPETKVAWRDEVSLITGALLEQYLPTDLLEDYPLKAHELLRDNINRVFDRLKKLKAHGETPVWLASEDGSVEVTTLSLLIDSGKDNLGFKTVLLPPSAGGLDNGLLTANSISANDVADELYDESRQRRVRLWEHDPRLEVVQKSMRLIRIVNLHPDSDISDSELNDAPESRLWYWYELPSSGDGDGSKASKLPVAWQVHTDDVTRNVEQIVKALPLSYELRSALIVAAKFHDLGKKRALWQRSIGNPTPTNWLAKSGGRMKPRELGET